MNNVEIAKNYLTNRGENVRYAAERNAETVECGVGCYAVVYCIVRNGAVVTTITD